MIEQELRGHADAIAQSLSAAMRRQLVRGTAIPVDRRRNRPGRLAVAGAACPAFTRVCRGVEADVFQPPSTPSDSASAWIICRTQPMTLGLHDVAPRRQQRFVEGAQHRLHGSAVRRAGSPR
jgi:hypothetical protein